MYNPLRGPRGKRGLRTNNFDPLAYIESAFLDTEIEEPVRERTTPDGPLSDGPMSVQIPSISDYLGLRVADPDEEGEDESGEGTKARFRKTVMSAPRPRRVKQKPSAADDCNLAQRAIARSTQARRGEPRTRESGLFTRLEVVV